jgi:hypothetical protein
MRRVTSRRLAVCTALAVALCPVLLAAPQQEKYQTFTGKVVPLAGLVEKIGSKLDADAAPHWLALVTDDGKVYPLIKDGGSRMFFKDRALLNRPMRLTGRLLPGSQLLQVIEVHSLRNGKLHEIYYWCKVCSIRRSEKNACECCGGPMELKEEPLGK